MNNKISGNVSVHNFKQQHLARNIKDQAAQGFRGTSEKRGAGMLQGSTKFTTHFISNCPSFSPKNFKQTIRYPWELILATRITKILKNM